MSSTAIKLAHLVTGEKYSDKQMEHIFEQAKGVVYGEEIIHPDNKTASNLLEILHAISNHSFLALVRDPKSELFRVKNSRVCNKKLRKEKRKGAQHRTRLTKLQSKKKTLTKYVLCTVNVIDEALVKSAMTLDDSEAMFLFVAWRSDEDLRHITMFPEVLSFDTTHGSNQERRPFLVCDGTDHNRKNFTALRAFLTSECEWVFCYAFEVIPTLVGRSTVERISQINADGDSHIYNPLANCI
jgi:hypothetical protein